MLAVAVGDAAAAVVGRLAAQVRAAGGRAGPPGAKTWEGSLACAAASALAALLVAGLGAPAALACGAAAALAERPRAPLDDNVRIAAAAGAAAWGAPAALAWLSAAAAR
jgi:dolichol kinase